MFEQYELDLIKDAPVLNNPDEFDDYANWEDWMKQTIERYFLEVGDDSIENITPETREIMAFENCADEILQNWNSADYIGKYVMKNILTKYKMFERLVQYSQEKIKRIEERARIQLETSVLIQKWNMMINQRCFKNEIPIEFALRTIMSVMLKDIVKVNVNGKNIPFFIHTFIIQDAGSGKDVLIDCIRDTINNVNKRISEMSMQDDDAFFNMNKYIVREISRSDTPESWQDNYAKKNQKVIDQVVKGMISTTDLMLLREGSFILDNNKATTRHSDKREILLNVLEGRTAPKSLESWYFNGEKKWTHTKLKGCLFATSRPVDTIKENVINSGLFQRLLVYVREGIPNEVRKDMYQQVVDTMFNDGKKYDKLMEAVIDEIIDVINFAIKNPSLEIEDPKLLITMVFDEINKMYNETQTTIFDKRHQNILSNFIARYGSLIQLNAYLHAYMRKSEKVEACDVKNAIDIVRKSFNSIVNWVCINVEEQKKNTKQSNLATKINTILATNKILKSKDIFKIASDNKISKPTAILVIRAIKKGEYLPVDYNAEDKVFYIKEKK